jgi:hypothetical protein
MKKIALAGVFIFWLLEHVYNFVIKFCFKLSGNSKNLDILKSSVE